jgi:hypothetical protein
MRPENKRMKEFLASNGIFANVKYIATGSLKRTWRLFNTNTQWTEDLAVKLNLLSFINYDNKPLGKYSGNGGRFSVFVRGHDEFLQS